MVYKNEPSRVFIHHNDIIIMCRRAVLRMWKESSGTGATYGKLLRICCEERVTSVAEAICNVLKARKESKRTADGKINILNMHGLIVLSLWAYT